MKTLLLFLFLIALLLGGLFGTGTALLFQWPVYFVLGLSGVVSLAAWRVKPSFAPSDLCLASGSLFLGYVLVRALTSPVAYIARWDLYLALACCLVYAMTALVFTRSRDRLAIFWLLVGVVLINLAVGLVHFAGKPEFTLFPDYERTYPAGRIGGQFNNPNHLGAFLAFMGLMSLAQAGFGRGGAALRMFLIFLAMMMLLGLVLTVSRGAMLGVIAGVGVLSVLAFYTLRQLYPDIFKKAAIALGVVMFVAAFALVALNLTFIKQRMFQGDAFTEHARMHFWRAGLDQFASSPLFGTGSRTYYYLSRLYRPPELVFAEGEIEYVHNDYIQLLAEYGVVGAFLFLAAAALHFGNGLRFIRWFCKERFRRTKQAASTQLAFVAGTLAGMAALLLHAVFDFHFHITIVALVGSFAMGVMANPGFAATQRGRWSIPMLRAGLKGAVIVAGGVMIFFGFNYGRSELYLDRGNRYTGAQLSFENVSFYSRAKELDPGNPFVHAASASSWRMRVLEGMPYAVQKSFLEKAKEDYEAAYRLYPCDIYIILPLARCLDDLGLHEQAEEKFLEALEWAPLFLYPRLEYAIHLHRLLRFDEAGKAYNAALNGHPLREIHTSIARIQKLQLDLAKDRKKAEKEEKPEPSNP